MDVKCDEVGDVREGPVQAEMSSGGMDDRERCKRESNPRTEQERDVQCEQKAEIMLAR